ncbi:MAG TPA: EAL domain-containing protein [Xanthomonadaceae bacterium]|jgi:diguanylate cyclase (GGDEF)-like protein|nr:EAL domain-containing protein [Xanthomonadaceae bacterium]
MSVTFPEPVAALDLPGIGPMSDLGIALTHRARSVPGFRQLALSWSQGVQGAEWRSGPLSPKVEALLDRMIEQADGQARNKGSGLAVCWRIEQADSWLAVAIEMDSEQLPHDWSLLLDRAHLFGAALLERTHLSARVLRLQKAEQLQGALYAIADLASAQMEMPKMLRGLHQIVAGLMYAENFFIALYDEGNDSLRFLYFADVLDPFEADPDMEIPLEALPNSLTVGLIRRGHAFMGPSDTVRQQMGMVYDDEHGPESYAWLGVPMLADSKVRGAIVVQSYDALVGYDDDDRTLLSYVAQHILTALDRKQQQSELERRVFERTRELAMANLELRSEVVERQRAEQLQRALYKIAELSIAADTLEQFYAAVHEEVGGLLYARNFFIALLSEDGDEIHFPYSIDERDAHRVPRRLSRGLTEFVLRTGKPLLVDRDAIRKLERADEVHSIGTPSVCWLGVPLMRDERTVGVIVVQSYTPDIHYTERDQELLTFVSFHIASGLLRKRAQDNLKAAYAELERRVEERTRELANANRKLRGQIAERERAEESLTHQALHDALTGLPNRTRLLDRMQRAMAAYQRDPERGFAVLFLDLDRFKVVNDSVGHLVGDELLKQASRLIAGAVRLPDTVARLGGDEFSVLVEDIKSSTEACEVAQRIIAALATPIMIAGKELFTSASVGIAMAGSQYRRPEELLRDADVAMYRAKNRGRSRFELFDEALRFEALRVHDLESDLRRAIAAGDFIPYFQPIVRLSDRRTIGYEALLRWQHEERGVLSPIEFLTVAEDSGLIEQIDWLMFDETCRRFDVVAMDGEYVSINVSPRHFRTPDLAPRLLALARRYGIAPGRLRIELTEGALLDNSVSVLNTLEQLRDGGIWAQLDDFGTGYSALSYLHRFPIKALKIDRSFVADLIIADGKGSEMVVRAILALASSLGIDAVGEGIETEAQCELLEALSCRLGQGFLFAHPSPATASAH